MKAPYPLFDTLDNMPNPWREPPRISAAMLASCKQALPASAADDYRSASEFLYSYRGSPDTFTAYRRELEHFLQWSWLIAGLSLREIQREHLESYVEFSRQPPDTWIGRKQVPRFIERQGERVANPDWRPYQAHPDQPYALSQSGLQAMFAVLSSFFNYLVQENQLQANPVARIRQKGKFLRKRQGQDKIRRLSQIQWDVVIETAEEMADKDGDTHERTLFIMTALFAMYLRISELVETERWIPQMGHFQRDLEGNWWFLTVGKGNKEREVSVSDAMLQALRRYRESRGLSVMPLPGEATPLIHKTRGKGGITSTRQIRSIVQKCFNQAEAKLRAEGSIEEAERLATATVHWLRHTGISEDVKHRPREHVRDDAGHGSSAITDRYIDVERAERHASARNKPVTK
ncbi:tyrosine-type recombinase/integrase [Pseudohongiella sp.]|uniref:Tyr recombinase domain-containing protein n=1 Tax=marine sediment metagenome TaxID=412755 RepID=A0A0F9YE94_9ZZZZ|nr:tyrosine-type recombinase/integrase [Pseudohongiella sp.]HDZ09769.1 site-specific integrase [Pseudohongiella sp.]HEA61617.1 site-specific integrase [Pseudohongiella sp.]